MVKCIIELNDSPEVVVNDVYDLGLKVFDIVPVKGTNAEVREIVHDREFGDDITSITVYKTYSAGVPQ